MAQLYEQYMYKPIDNFDLSLNITEPSLNNHNSTYMSVDQTFHTPSFGDEEFDIPPLHLPPTDDSANERAEIYNRQQQQVLANQTQQMAMAPPNSLPPQRMMETHYPTSTGPQEMYMVQMNAQNTMHITNRNYNMEQEQHRYQAMGQQCHPHPSVGGCQLTTISQSQLSNQLGLQIGMTMRPHGGGGPGSNSSTPPGSNHTSPGLETSEDSDDCAPMSQLMGTVKRPSPELIDQSLTVRTTAPKKSKPQKKKKKKDPNEPQKPVSAYALFFRDRQAAIKGQNPSASFGEVSKIVASMWDSLDVEHKNVYKKKTEVAKKEYLKALAAYRASLVSKQAAADQTDAVYVTSPTSTVSSGASSSPDRNQSLSPMQKKSPLLSSLMEGGGPQIMTSMNAMSPPHSSIVTSQVWAMPISTAPTTVHQSSPLGQTNVIEVPPPTLVPQVASPPSMTRQVSSPPMMQSTINQSQLVQSIQQQQQQQQQQQNMNQSISSPSYTQNVNSPSPPHMPPSTNMSQIPISQSPIQTCLRHGCSNPPIDSPDWDREYCSNECVVSHCRDVFTAWVASRQANNAYASVK